MEEGAIDSLKLASLLLLLLPFPIAPLCPPRLSPVGPLAAEAGVSPEGKVEV